MSTNEELPTFSKKDFMSDQMVRWCPGCGDYAILSQVQSVFADLGIAKEDFVVISGIGCSSRFPYYMDTYGFHTIHGRAPAFATGVKLANPKLSVWQITGDGDALSIGGNHFIHILRRNVDIQLLLFNNRIYGLTKGQYSPTSQIGTRSPSSPEGSIDSPLSPCFVAFGSGGTFIARSIDTEARHLSETAKRAHAHRGAAFIEILQNCPIYNDGIFEQVKDKKLAPDFRVEVEHGQPITFGRDNEKAIHLNREKLSLEIIATAGNEDKVLVHDEANRSQAQLLSAMDGPEFPTAVGVLFREEKTSFTEESQRQRKKARSKPGSLRALLHSGHTWDVK